MPSIGKLSEYPDLLRWLQERGTTPPDAGQPADLLVWRTCEALDTSGAHAVRRWLDGFRQFLGVTGDALRDFLAAEAIMHGCNVELLDLIGDFGDTAVRTNEASSFLAAMQAGADRTGLVVLRFLAAWTALNTGRLEDCIAECEKVDEPFGAIFTVHGQALLELARPEEASEVLEVAVKLAPGEILAWFQLAKAQHVLGHCDAALNALRACRRLAPQSDEVALYMGLVALDAEAECRGAASEALTALKPALKRHAGTPTLVYTLLRLACRVPDKEALTGALDEVDWTTMLAKPDCLQPLAPLLRDLHAAGWMDVAATLLARVTPEGS